ncbi:MAG: PHP domain-containing protein [Verrucomicrobia bacterium]|nr:PHP domain-containing protein [Verrucomicrobiota bacterium]
MKADLHLHSNYSDGTESPAEVVARAARLRIDVVAVTDHDTVAGTAEAMEAGRRLGVRVVPGAEITARFHNQELHLLAYFRAESRDDAGWRHPDLLRELEYSVRQRALRARKIVEKLNHLGVSMTMEEVLQATARLANAPESSGQRVTAALGRPHIAAALLAAKHVSSMEEAFARYLKKGRPAWVDKERAEAEVIIALVHRAGGIAILAHPGLLRDGNIPHRLREWGMDGVEVYHSRHSAAQAAHFRRWTVENGLLVTGGSDCHGMLKGEPLMGHVELRGEELERFFARLGGETA